MQPLAFGGRQVAVDRGAQDRGAEADRAARIPRSRRRPAQPSPPPPRRPSVPASRAASPIWAPSPSTLSARASVAAAGASRAKRSSTALATPRGTIVPTSAAAAVVGSRPRAAASLEQLAEQETDCRPSPRDTRARTDRRARRTAGGDQLATPPRVSGDGRSSSVAGSPTSVAASGVSAGSERPSGENQPKRLAIESARDERQRARRRRVAPLQVVDHQHERRIGGQIRRQPVQAVLPRVAGVAGGGPDNGRPRRRAGHADVSTSAASAAAPASQRSRSPGIGVDERTLEQLARDTERETLLELRRARAQARRTPSPPREQRASPAAATSPSPRRPRSRARPPPAAPPRAPRRRPARPRARARAAPPAR